VTGGTSPIGDDAGQSDEETGPGGDGGEGSVLWSSTWSAGEAVEQESGLPQRFGFNVTMNYAALVATALSSLLVTPVLLHSLGQSAYGVWSLAGGVIGYLELLELGFGRATTKLLAEDIGHRPDRLLRTLNTNVAVLSAFGLLAFVAGVVIAVASPALFSIPPSLRGASVTVFVVLAVALAVSIPFDSFGGALAAHQRYDLLAASNIGLVVATSVTIVGVVLAGGGLVALALGTALVSLPFHVLRWRLLRRLQPHMRLSRRYVDRSRLRESAGLSWWFLIADVAITIILKVDLIVVGLLFGVRAVAIYAVGSKAAQLFINALRALVQVYFPHASALGREGKTDELRRLVVDGTRATLVLSVPLTVVLVLISHAAIRVWVGAGYGRSAEILVVLTLAMAVRSTASTAAVVLAGSGRARAVAGAGMVEAAVNLGSSVALGVALGPIGVAYGTLVGAVLVQAPWMVALSCRVSSMTLRRFAVESIVPHLLPAVLTTATLVAGRAVWSGSTVHLLVLSAAAVVVYLGTYFAFGATPVERRRVLDGVRAIGSRRRPSAR